MYGVAISVVLISKVTKTVMDKVIEQQNRPLKRYISERPDYIETREEFGYWEIDSVMGKGSKDCIVTLVERKSGCVQIGKLKNHTKMK